MVRAFLAAVLVMISGIAWAGGAPPNIQKMYDQMAESTVKLNDNCSSEIIYSARDAKTGKVETLILTAKHCVADAKAGETQKVEKTVYDKKLNAVSMLTYYGDVIGRSASSDVALVKLRDSDTFFEKTIALESADTQLYSGEDVTLTAYPLALSLTITKGMLGQVERNKVTGDEHGYFRATPDLAGGSSGGGLYHQDAAGNYKLIWITTAGYERGTFINLFTTIDDIESYLKVAAPQIYAAK